MAHVKSGGGKQKNGRDSNPQYLGVKRYGGEFVTAGSIIVRQRGSKFHPGEFAGKGRDDTIFAKIDGHVKFHTRRNRKFISIEPAAA
ncbi:MAG: 50S ribosomal protein L27 [Candidatus Hinthialibacter antarcticus]|nr:50S ribosomal protein L27 [Candidatus Hinthialibacter antarcticus]